MSVPDFRLCDVCQQPTKIGEFPFFDERRMSAAGSSEDEYETYDLCEKHCAELIRHLTQGRTDDHRKASRACIANVEMMIRKHKET